MKKIIVDLGERSYPIYIGSGLLKDVGRISRQHGLGKQVAVISDETVGSLYGSPVFDALTNTGLQVALYSVPDGEESKSWRIADFLYEKLIQGKFDRNSTLVALGGGVVGDLVGFVAATYLRGVSYVQIPTTLLAQIDSSVGGKVGINHRLGKNLIGAFHQPKFVVIDPDVLKSLPSREVWAGMAEVVKYGLIRDKLFFEFLEQNLDAIATLGDRRILVNTIEHCCRIKAGVVSQDEREGGLRRILNFGHTLGHAFEAVTNYSHFRHGEAVLLGMRGAAWLSLQKGFLQPADFQKVERILARIRIAVSMPQLNPLEILEKMDMDKKVSEEKLHFVLLAKIGKATIMSDLTDKELLSTIQYVLQ